MNIIVISYHTDTFSSLKDLKFIFLDNNHLTTLPANVFATSGRKLTLIDLKDNNINTIDVGAFPGKCRSTLNLN